jgi:hypothetical protein
MRTRSPRFGFRLELTVLATLLVLPSMAAAQAKFWGLLGGATLSDYSDDFGGFETNDRWGGTAGLIFGVRTANWMAVALEPAWHQMGGDDLRVDYLDVPLTFGGVGKSRDGSMRYGGYTGISAAFKLSCSVPSSAVTDVCDDVKGTAWFVPIGVRFLRRTSGATFFGLDVRYSIPLGSSFDIVDANQRSWAFRLMFVKGAIPGGA